MADYKIEIERVANGYEVEICDPKIMAQNEKMSNDRLSAGYKDPKVCYVFKTEKEVLDFLSKNMGKALPVDAYDAGFDAAMKDEQDD